MQIPPASYRPPKPQTAKELIAANAQSLIEQLEELHFHLDARTRDNLNGGRFKLLPAATARSD
jgi:hypothetical protein